MIIMILVVCNCRYIVAGAYELPKEARSIQLRIIAQNGICIYSSMSNAVLRSWTLLAAFGGSYAPDSRFVQL